MISKYIPSSLRNQTTLTMRSGCSIILFMIAFALSVFFQGTNSILYAPAVLCLFTLALILWLPHLRSGQWHLPVSATVFFVMAFGLYALLSLSWTTVPYVSTIFTLIIGMLPFLFFVFITSPEAPCVTEIHYRAMGGVIAGFAVWALIQFFFLYEQYGTRIHHPMLNPNDLAGLFCLGLLPALAFYFSTQKRGQIMASLALFALLYIALLATQSLGGFISFCTATAVILIYILIQSPRPWLKLSALLMTLGPLPFLINVMTGGKLYDKNISRLDGMVSAQSKSVTDRLLLWQSTWEMIKDHVWLGTGLGSFYFYYPAYRSPEEFSDGYFAHMDPLQFWSDMGVLAPALFYAAAIAILLRTIRAMRQAPANHHNKLPLLGAFCGMLALLMNTHISFHLYMPAIIIPLATLLAYWYIKTEDLLSGNERTTITLTKPKNKILTVSILFLCCLCSLWALRWGAGVHMLEKAYPLIRQPQTEDQALAILQTAGKVAPPSFGKDEEYKAQIYVNKYLRQRATLSRSEQQKLFDQALIYLDEAQRRNPRYTAIWDLRAQLYYGAAGPLLPDGRRRAIALLEDIMDANPLALNSRLALAGIYQRIGEFDRAYNLLEEGLEWPRRRGVTDIKLLTAAAQMRRQKGDTEGAAALSQEAIRRARQYGLIAGEQ